MALLKKRGYNEKWNNDDDVNHQSVTPFYRITTHASTNLHPYSGRASLSPDPVSSGPLYAETRPGALDDSSSALRLVTALWPHVLPSRNNYSRDASPSAIDIVHLPRLLPQTLGGVVWTLRRSEAL